MDKVHFSTGKDDWGTPQELFDTLNKEFGFTLDACANADNHKCEKYYTEEQDGLLQSWACETIFCNPPYSRRGGQEKWIKKCYEESKKHGITVVALLPARTDTKAFHTYILGKAEIRFIRGRVNFEIRRGEKGGRAPFPNMVVIFRQGQPADALKSISECGEVNEENK